MTLEFIPASSTSYTLSEIVYYLGIVYLCSIFPARMNIDTPVRLKKIHFEISIDESIQGVDLGKLSL